MTMLRIHNFWHLRICPITGLLLCKFNNSVPLPRSRFTDSVYCRTSNVKATLVDNKFDDRSVYSWNIACGRCSNYIFFST